MRGSRRSQPDQSDHLLKSSTSPKTVVTRAFTVVDRSTLYTPGRVTTYAPRATTTRTAPTRGFLITVPPTTGGARPSRARVTDGLILTPAIGRPRCVVRRHPSSHSRTA